MDSKTLEKRRKYVTATDIGAICGLSKWKSMFDVWNEKVYGEHEDQNKNADSKEWGQRLEPLIAEKFTDVTGKKLVKGTWIADPIRHEACTPDFLIAGRGSKELLECKTVHMFAAREWKDPEKFPEGIPDLYYVQIQWQLKMTNYEIGYCAVLIGGSDFRIYKIKRDDKVIAALEEKKKDFWRYVEEEEIPPPQGNKKENNFLDRKIKEGSRELFQATEEEAGLLYDYKKALEDVKEYEQIAEKLKAQIKLRVGERGGLLHDNIKLTWYEQKPRKSVSYAKIVKELKASDELITKYTSVSKPSRVFKFEVS